jgi:hypothetical protein
MTSLVSALEISTLPARHPVTGAALLRFYAPALIVQLGGIASHGTINREVAVNWCRRTHSQRETVTRVLGWSGMSKEVLFACEQLPRTKNQNGLTEDAAITAAALLLHDLEKGSLESVLEIGSGGDYLVRITGCRAAFQLEVSGVFEDVDGDRSRNRLSQKCRQVLTNANSGYVSVTTFHHGQQDVVHSYLHFTRKRQRKGGRGLS